MLGFPESGGGAAAGTRTSRYNPPPILVDPTTVPYATLGIASFFFA